MREVRGSGKRHARRRECERANVCEASILIEKELMKKGTHGEGNAKESAKEIAKREAREQFCAEMPSVSFSQNSNSMQDIT